MVHEVKDLVLTCISCTKCLFSRCKLLLMVCCGEHPDLQWFYWLLVCTVSNIEIWWSLTYWSMSCCFYFKVGSSQLTVACFFMQLVSRLAPDDLVSQLHSFLPMLFDAFGNQDADVRKVQVFSFLLVIHRKLQLSTFKILMCS